MRGDVARHVRAAAIKMEHLRLRTDHRTKPHCSIAHIMKHDHGCDTSTE
jgi:hypothetical protein